MRKDVKFGMALSLVVVVVAGWYFTRDVDQEAPISLAKDAVNAAGETVPVTDVVKDAGESPERGIVKKEAAVQSSATVPVSSAAVAESVSAERAVAVGESDSEESPEAFLTAERPLSHGAGEAPVVEEAAKSPLLDLAQALGTRATPREKPGEPAVRDAETLGTQARAARESSPPSAHAARLPESRVKKPASATVQAGAGDDAVETYKVQSGDSFAVLAEVYYGSQRYTKFLMDANPRIARPEDLRVGMTILIPPLPDATGRAAKGSTPPASLPPGQRGYLVKKNDSFYRIAERELGAGSRWRELFELNKDVVDGDSNGLRPGMRLRLPKQKG